MSQNEGAADVVRRYLDGELDLDAAASEISQLAPPGRGTDPTDAKLNDLFGAVQPMTTWACVIIVITVTKCK